MRISGVGTFNTNPLFSDANVFRGADYVTNQGTAFIGGRSNSAGVGDLIHVGLHNPTGSGVTILLDRLFISVTTSQYLTLSYLVGGLATSTAWKSKLAPVTDGAGLVEFESKAVQVGDQITTFRILANSPLMMEFDKPFELIENSSLIGVGGITNNQLAMQFEGREV